MDSAVERLDKAIKNNEPILLYGDYDVDGTTAVALSYSFLSKYHSKLDYYIPDRYKEGYGVSMQGVDYAQQNGIRLIIAMDCGIKAIDQVAEAKQRGIDFIICDHHLPYEHLPDAIAVLDPKRSDCNYPYKELSGCGVVFKLIQAFAKYRDIDNAEWIELLDILAISIACDIVPITGENRVLAHYGLKALNRTNRIGLKALIEISKRQLPMTISNIVFGIGPMINAAGRLADAKLAVKLLLANNKTIAYEYARMLYQKNKLRQEFEKNIVYEAKEMYVAEAGWEEKKSVVLFNPSWHKGVVGIAAAKMVDHFYKPSIILTESNNKLVGSARTTRGFDIHNAIKQCDDLLENFGGHKHAAGLTLKKENLASFQKAFESVVASQINGEQQVPEIPIASTLEINKINDKFFSLLKQFAPFGPSNRNPVFVSTNLKDSGYSKLLKGNHLRLSLRQGEGTHISGIAFGQGDFYETIKSSPFHLCYNITENHWNGKRSLQLQVKDIRVAE